ncbi:hypothetical protein M2137_000617 [Parabacteroides sp. PFB2-10]|uniref:hypothetical protein n=1 Tax=unclassified Parabacteroides TaxID=2649774 RepID=UPI002476C173|nr:MULTISPECIES: hypothetical protein [unclassified Parabacteroides]MDH6311858.1 hypothetical protein [Parabacteroides sp. PFB2-10]MDH6343964.1 hypothetical protein [Parabacteroides sp. PM6-13]MDH6391675.1 hypothetical protein [Parabacteroides sp. PFB2-12]
MKRISTQRMFENSNIRKSSRKKATGTPRQQTLDFLAQFARVYRVEPALRQDLCSFVLN